jgi:hypothetical protein
MLCSMTFITRHATVCLLAATLAGFPPPARADVPKAQRGEVDHLLQYLRDSDCRMIRNGKAHDGAEAAQHVQRKYDHFRDEIGSTEEFIELSASRSTMSGKPYQVQCPGEPEQASRDWLLQELDSYRHLPQS